MANRLSYVQLDGTRRLVFGLEWVALDDVISHHEQIGVWRERGFAWSVSYRQKKQTQLGLAAAEDALEGVAGKGLAISGAALLANLPGVQGGSGLYILSTQGERTSVFAVGLIRGRIIFDKVISERDVPSLRSDFQGECDKSQVNAVFVGIAGQEQISGQVDQYITWDALTKARKGFKAAALQHLKSERSGWILVGVATVALAMVAGTWFWRDHNEQLQQRKLALQAWANDPAVIYQQSIQKFLSDPQALVPLGAALEELVPVLGRLQTQRGGWQLDSVECLMANGSCTAKWGLLEGKLGTYNSFRQAEPALAADWQLLFGTDMDKLQVVMPIKPARGPAPGREQLPTLQEFLARQTWQHYAVVGVQVTMQSPLAQQVPPNVSTQVAQNAPEGLWASRWMVAGAPWWAVDALKPKNMENTSNVTLDMLTLSLTGKEVKFSAEGKVYVRKP